MEILKNKMTSEIERNIKSNMTDEEIKRFIIDYTCKQCGNEFDKPGSCEECINYNETGAHKDYLYNLAIKRRDYLKLTAHG